MASVFAVADAFVREIDPPSNFGGAGLLCVGGTNSVNGLGQPRGRFDSVIRFDVSTAIASFDATMGTAHWEITGDQIEMTLVAAPENPLFPRSAGNFQIAWLSDDNWTEGTGTPNAPTIGTGNELTWQLLQTILAGASEANAGTFSYGGVGGTQIFPLTLSPQ